MIDILGLTYLMIFAPLICAAILLILKFVPKKTPDYANFILSTVFSIFSFMASCILLIYVITYQGYTLEDNYPFCVIQNIPLYFGIYTDNLASLFVALLSLLFFVANIFSYKYLRQNIQGFARFYIYLNLMQFFSFCFFISSNLVQSLVFTMMSSLVCYLFANFYFQNPQSQEYSKKAFILDATGDFMLLTATVALLFFSTLTPSIINLPTLGFNNINSLGLYSFASLNPIVYSFICLLLVLGALTKSSQFPLTSKITFYTQTPNPAFSLIISPILLGQGIFLLYRLYPLLNLTPVMFEVIKIIGILSAITCIIIASKENNLKYICSNIALSQAGIALFILGFRYYDTSVFYLLCSGMAIVLISCLFSAISYSTGLQENIKFLGGLREKLPLVTIAYIIGSLSLCGLIFSGFYPKTMFLNELITNNNSLYVILILPVIFLSAFSLFRVYFKTFEGHYRGNWEVQKTSKLIRFSIVLLAAPVIFFGFIFNRHVHTFLSFTEAKNPTPDFFVGVMALVASLLGYYLAYCIYFTKSIAPFRLRPIRRMVSKRFYSDIFIDFIFSSLPTVISKIFYLIEKYILGGFWLISVFIEKLIAYIKEKTETKNINSQFFSVIFWIFITALIFTILYFRAGVLK